VFFFQVEVDQIAQSQNRSSLVADFQITHQFLDLTLKEKLNPISGPDFRGAKKFTNNLLTKTLGRSLIFNLFELTVKLILGLTFLVAQLLNLLKK
jgi:hypothetical protein